MESDTLFPQRVQSGFEKASDALRRPEVKIRVLALLINNGMVTREDFDNAAKQAQRIREAQEKEAQRIAEENRKQSEILNRPDSKLPKLFRYKNVQPTPLLEYLTTYDLSALEDYLAELQKRPLHYASLYADPIIDVCALIERELAKRIDPNQRKLRELRETKRALLDAKEEMRDTQKQLKQVQQGTQELSHKVGMDKQPKPDYSR